MTAKFEYKEADAEGEETLDVIAGAGNFNRWMYETIRPFCSGKILEIGSGTGNISRYFIEQGAEIMLSDIRPGYCKRLETQFSGKKNLLGIRQMDLVIPEFGEKYKDLTGTFDAVFALNVVEHIEDDMLAVANAKKLLRENGTLIILVPAYQWLYNRFDKELFHFRRYNKRSLSALFLENNFTIRRKFFFNAMGMAGWFVSGKLFRNKILPGSQVSFYNKIIPLAKLIDAAMLNSTGLSVIVAGTK